MTAYELILEGYITAKGWMNIVQIGANDGKINDPIHNFVMRHKLNTNVLLIEPQLEIIPYLTENYAGHPSAAIYNGAIGPLDSISLFRVKPELWTSFKPAYLRDAPAYRVPSGFASSSAQHVYRHAKGSFNLDLPLEQCVEEIQVPCRNLPAVMAEMSWNHQIDLLQVDAEGADDTVLYSCGINHLKPAILNCELAHLGRERSSQLGQFLVGQGYRLLKWSGSDMIAMRDATLR